jgi:acetyl esterase/lipase
LTHDFYVANVGGLRDEDVDYALRLSRAGVPTELHVYPGAPHGFGLFPDLHAARQAARDAEDWLARQFAS